MNTCSICTRKFKNSDLLRNTRDEYFCEECFEFHYFDVTDEKKTEPQHKCKGDAPPERKKMFSTAELAAIKKKNVERPECSSSNTSLQCPHLECNHCISVFGLWAHFQHEHLEVPTIQTLLDTRIPLTFDPYEIRYGIKQCLALLNISLLKEEPNNNVTDSTTGKQKTGATLAVLASRVAAVHLAVEYNEDFLEEAAARENNDKIILWIASNIVCNNSCTVAVSTISEKVRVKYRGPVLQLGNNPIKLCMEGCCLILSHYHYLGMTENGLKPLRLDLIVHPED